MKHIKYHTLWILFAIGLFVGCKHEKPAENKTILIFYDLSSSTGNGSRESYFQNTKLILNDLAKGDELICEAITDKSIREKALIHKLISEPFKPTTTNAIGKATQEKKSDSLFNLICVEATTQIQLVLKDSNNQYPNTDIFSALTQAQLVFANFPNSKKILVIMSDMLESDSKYNFATATINDGITDKLINELRQQNMLPDLTGVEVYVAGADATNNNRFFTIRNFWQTYFKATGAQMLEEHYAASLIHFDE